MQCNDVVGTTAFKFQPHELIERLVAIVPRPRAHLVRYSGVLAPAFAARAQIVPSADKALPRTKALPPPEGAEMPKRPGRIPWAPLLWRVFSVDALACPRCGGRMRILAAILAPDVAQAILAHAGLPTGPPRPSPGLPWPPALHEPGQPRPDFFADPPAPEDA